MKTETQPAARSSAHRMVRRAYWTGKVALRDHDSGGNNWLPLYETEDEAAHYYGWSSIVRVYLITQNEKVERP